MSIHAFTPRRCPWCREPIAALLPLGTMHEDCKTRAEAAARRARKGQPRVIRLDTARGGGR